MSEVLLYSGGAGVQGYLAHKKRVQGYLAHQATIAGGGRDIRDRHAPQAREASREKLARDITTHNMDATEEMRPDA